MTKGGRILALRMGSSFSCAEGQLPWGAGVRSGGGSGGSPGARASETLKQAANSYGCFYKLGVTEQKEPYTISLFRVYIGEPDFLKLPDDLPSMLWIVGPFSGRRLGLIWASCCGPYYIPSEVSMSFRQTYSPSATERMIEPY